jgi:hypothetical protein
VISGEMLRAGLSIVHEANTSTSLPELAIVERDKSQRLEFTLSDWAEELQVISRRRNILEKRIRELSVNFIKFHSLNSGDKRSSKDRIVACLAEKRRKEFTNFSVDEISEKIYWLELKIIIVKEWPVFEKIFGDRRKFEEYFDIINDRPDAHAKSIDGADVALQRKALGWIEERMASV